MPSNKERVTFTFEGVRYTVRGDTKEEAYMKAAEKKLAMEKGLAYRESAMTVNEWFKEYLEVYKAGASEKTRYDYGLMYKNGIKPYIGRLPLKKVKPIHCQQVMNKNAGMSASYIHKVHILMKGMFQEAVNNDLLQRNPASATSKPQGVKGKRRALNEDEREVFLLAADLCGDAGLFCKVIYYCGLRPSEVNRIKGGDYANGMLHVRGQKTANAERDVPIPDALTLPSVPKGKLLFKTANGGERDRGGSMRYWLKVKREMENYGPVSDTLTLYCLRHDYCTRLQDAGVPINVARLLMGHSSVEVTAQIYTHSTELTLRKASELINAYEKAL